MKTPERQMDPDRCQKLVWRSGQLRSVQCTRRHVEGGQFCTQHSPETAAARDSARETRWNEYLARQEAVRAKKARLLAIVNDEAREILRELGVSP